MMVKAFKWLVVLLVAGLLLHGCLNVIDAVGVKNGQGSVNEAFKNDVRKMIGDPPKEEARRASAGRHKKNLSSD